MGSSKLMLFGSFTEDEIRSLKNKPRENVAEVPVRKTEFQFGSLPPVAGEVYMSPSNEKGKLLGSSAKSVNLVKKDAHLPNKNDLQGSEKVSKENGIGLGSENSSPLSNGVQSNRAVSSDLSSLCLSNTSRAVQSQPLLSTPRARQDTRSKVIHSNGSHNESQMLAAKNVGKTASSGAINAVSDLLPRGLINAGNLCFLNATLQALLSCSPFVKLLQELRTRDIRKVDFPTLVAFVDFLSEFDLPPNSSSKKKDPASIEMGRPFSPAMFEGVVKNFTPDVPSGFSGRTRQEDAQEFLSYVMDRLHDELLKLGGQASGMGGNKSSLVSSSEDDEWETVGRKNKSVVTRTQSFVPSELSAIFGGQLKSVVKAKGNRDSETVQPYLLLHLDIFSEAVCTIEDALRLFSAPETLEGYRAANTGKKIKEKRILRRGKGPNENKRKTKLPNLCQIYRFINQPPTLYL
ncbi:hypothetical protein KSS87_020288 [Heliosperma pusillum]|nr:hypothetical protein KSS87_020288 [Heliosperma pusillum]